MSKSLSFLSFATAGAAIRWGLMSRKKNTVTPLFWLIPRLLITSLPTIPTACWALPGKTWAFPTGRWAIPEVGHLNLGAGRVVYQDLCRVDNAIKDGSMGENAVLKTAFSQAVSSRLHLLGLVSDGGVHSHINHLAGIVKYAYEAGCAIFAFMPLRTGAIVPPPAEPDLCASLRAVVPYGAKIATVIGRFYAMDRDKRWDRNKLAWDAIVLGRGEQCSCSPAEYVEQCYAKGETDEFLKPGIFAYGNEQRVRDNDVVFFFTFPCRPSPPDERRLPVFRFLTDLTAKCSRRCIM